MADVMTPGQRYRAMLHNRGRTQPELSLASALWHRGLRYNTAEGYKRLFGRPLIGQPDIVFPSKKTIIFVDGCFWHGCQVCDTGVDRSTKFWQRKVAANKDRDLSTTQRLETDGWQVLRVPEHEIKTKVGLENTTDKLVRLLHKR